MNFRWQFLDRFKDFGHLVLRVGIGAMFIVHHGWPKLMGGPGRWESVGHAVSYVGIHFAYTGWGLVAALIELLGGICLILGFAFRPAALLLTLMLAVAAIHEYYPFGGLKAAGYPIEIGIVTLALFFMGAGRWSMDAKG